jgi:hypothetical protein
MALTYETLTAAPDRAIAAFYDFIGERLFAHDFENVEFDAAEFDRRLGTPRAAPAACAARNGAAFSHRIPQRELRMTVPIDFLEGATVVSETVEPNEDADAVLWKRGTEGTDGIIHVFALKTSAGSIRFRLQRQWALDGEDYAVLIRKFGWVATATFKSFNDAEISAIKQFLESYFLSHDIPNFTRSSRRPFAVYFEDNWIIRSSGELHEWRLRDEW